MARRRPCAREPGPVSFLFFFFAIDPLLLLSLLVCDWRWSSLWCWFDARSVLFGCVASSFFPFGSVCVMYGVCVCACVRGWEHECILGPSAPATRGRPCGACRRGDGRPRGVRLGLLGRCLPGQAAADEFLARLDVDASPTGQPPPQLQSGAYPFQRPRNARRALGGSGTAHTNAHPNAHTYGRKNQ